MSGAQHTPGPWTFAMFKRAIARDEVPRIYGPGGLDIAETISKDDARLIAAAPDLLAALEGYLSVYRMDPFANASNGLNEKARAAIAKAKGQA